VCDVIISGTVCICRNAYPRANGGTYFSGHHCAGRNRSGGNSCPNFSCYVCDFSSYLSGYHCGGNDCGNLSPYHCGCRHYPSGNCDSLFNCYTYTSGDHSCGGNTCASFHVNFYIYFYCYTHCFSDSSSSESKCSRYCLCDDSSECDPNCHTHSNFKSIRYRYRDRFPVAYGVSVTDTSWDR
jgi:hypothetical protein